MSDKDDRSSKSAKNTKQVSRKFHATRKHDTERERNQGEVSCCCVMYVQDKAVSQNGEERGKAFDRMDERDGNLVHRMGRENVSTNLEESERECGRNNITARVSNAIFKGRDSSSESRKQMCQICKRSTPERHKGELNQCQRDRIWKHV